ncbi:S-adenosyl-L-methionine-dependent methyltransferase [Cucurbitaria berberidis CBS 394.84]|uniref:S-adenosyl-L-methionine-dependent methyltransferase n=1 Tax=Cucurbitaria berberidis CBS 394.84 TaxID=1168544 RepID=A0A9P4GBE3_9PLEO|nr:S-adenosyl-L-methionine-dependent methyltransferase [Cucurbitaria berberidis CBS 394.84]KAF1842507.1 S-adenosyl-L-methionine-dependent methyltransferase [Cucurbitaria berberidis CBS 394.84]
MPASGKEKEVTSQIPADAPVARGDTTHEDTTALSASVPVASAIPAPPAETSTGASSSTAQQINPIVTVDDNTTSPDDSDSAYGDDDHLSDTTSIPSTIWRHRYENGRRYHKFREGEYWGPNDEVQNDQLDIAHHMFLILLHQKLHLAPIKEPKSIIDLGCGTGIWCMDMADEHPGAEIIGVDLSPIQPSFTPPNCKFEIDDVTSPWTYQPTQFDFVNIRGLYGSIADWRALYAQAFNHMQPGGYIHQLEMSIQFKSDDGTLTPDHALSQWSDIFHEASKKFGKSFFEVWNLSTYIKDTGFTDVVEQIYKVPVNGWPADPHMKELGRWNFLHCTQGAEGWGLMLLTKVMGWSIEEAQVFIAKFRNGLKERRVHAYFEVVVIHARKPTA